MKILQISVKYLEFITIIVKIGKTRNRERIVIIENHACKVVEVMTGIKKRTLIRRKN
ncbi:hypothetical protein [Bacillus paranthracis]|uniref:hypothetical protein n=1 Tax=Bacillus paranthracis TaxID=2026186 RepID=UPI003D24256F